MEAEEEKINIRQKLWKLFSAQTLAIAAAFAALVSIYFFAYDHGKQFNERHFDEEKSRFIEEKKELLLAKAYLKNRITSDSLSQENWLRQHVKDVHFLPYGPDERYVHVVNASNNPCIGGKQDSCWKTTEYARIGDVIAVSVYIHNDENKIIKRVSAGFKTYPVSEYPVNAIRIAGGIAIEGKVFINENVIVYCEEQAIVSPMGGEVRFYDNRDGKLIPNLLLSFPGYNFGDISPGVKNAMWVTLWLRILRKLP